MEKPPRKKRRVVRPQQYHVLAPQPSLELLPDSLLLKILSLLDVHSLIRLSRVCKRFYQLYTDEYIWNDADLTSRSIGSRLDVRKLKKIVHDRIPPTLKTVKLSSNYPKKPPVITASVLNDLFYKCSAIKNITLENCDLTTFPSDCKFYRSGTLECITLTHCEVQFGWMETVRPEWPKLRHLSLAKTTKISDCDLKCIAGCDAWAKSLRSLNLSNCYRVTDAGIKAICESLIQLRTLDISSCSSVTDASLQHIATLTHLEHLSIANIRIPMTEETYKKLPKLFPSLRTLCLSDVETSMKLLLPKTNTIYIFVVN